MINRWIIVLLVTLSLANGIPSPGRRESISSDSRVFLEDNSYDLPHSRQRRVGRQPDVSTNQTEKAETTTTVMSPSSTTTVSSEAKDMEETSVNPKDDDDVTVLPPTEKNVDKSTTLIPNQETSKKVIANDNKTTPVKNETLTSTTEMTLNTATTTTVAPIVTASPVTPANKDKSDMTKPPEELPENATPINEASADIQEILKYTTEGADPSTEDIKFHPLSAENTTSTLEPPTVTAKSREEQVEEQLEKKSNLEQAPKKEKAGLSTGIVALIIAVAFAGIAVLGFVALQVHKRYLEYRHGNRELLVNDFDANDINNFEL